MELIPLNSTKFLERTPVRIFGLSSISTGKIRGWISQKKKITVIISRQIFTTILVEITRGKSEWSNTSWRNSEEIPLSIS